MSNARGAVELAADSAVGCKTGLARPLLLLNEFAPTEHPTKTPLDLPTNPLPASTRLLHPHTSTLRDQFLRFDLLPHDNSVDQLDLHQFATNNRFTLGCCLSALTPLIVRWPLVVL